MTAPAKPADSKDARAERLAAALRENLKRRKAQTRAKDDGGKQPDRAAPGFGRKPPP